MEQEVTVRGKDFYVEDLGDSQTPALLYLHGGPGTGSYDFVLHQGERLAAQVRLIAFDQRGVLRSQPLEEGEPFGLDDLVEDCEALRTALDIPQWSVLGHSFGGYLAVAYALAYPESVQRLVLENPSLDLGSSARELLRRAALEYGVTGDARATLACLDAAAAPESTPVTVWKRMGELLDALGARRSNL